MHVTYFKSRTRITDRELLKFTTQSAITGKTRKITLTLPRSKPSMLGILFSTFLNCVINCVFVAKLLISGLFSAVVILPPISAILLLKVLVCKNPVTLGIFQFMSPTSLSYLVFKTYFVVSVPYNFVFKL